MINYIEKHGLHTALDLAGLHIGRKDEVWESKANHEVINQFIIDFDGIGALRAELKAGLVFSYL